MNMVVECAWDDCNQEFTTEQGMKCHHTKTHGVSLAYTEQECVVCGETYTCQNSQAKNRSTCSMECKGKRRSDKWTGEDHWNYNKEVVICDNCGDDIEVSQHEKDSRRFCNKDCRKDFHRLTVMCDWCGDDITRPQSLIGEYNYCDKECRVQGTAERISESNTGNYRNGATKQITHDCNYCGLETTTPKVDYERNGGGFCDRDCFEDSLSESNKGEDNFNWAGGYEPYYGPNWLSQRRKALERDDYICQWCGMNDDEHHDRWTRELEVHHAIPFRTFDHYLEANKLINLTTLCKECHCTVEKWIRPIYL